MKRIFLSPPHMSGKELQFIHEAFDSNYIAPLGPQVNAFEKEFSERTGIPYAAALSSGTAAMHLALRYLGIGPGDEVFASTLTFIGSVTPVIFEGASPVFIDSDRASWNMDTDLLADELEQCYIKGKLPKAVIPTDLYGQCADYDRIAAVCELYQIPLIIDSAESLGAEYKGRCAGKGAKAAVYSFNGNKIITTSGGGMLASEDKNLIDHARFLSQQARDPAPHYEHTQIGYNYRMSNILAAIGRGQLQVLDERVKRKREIFDYYYNALNDIPGIEFMPEPSYSKSNRWLTVILITPEIFGADREKVRLALEAENIESRPVWKPMHMQPVFGGQGAEGRGQRGKTYKTRVVGGEVAEDLFARGLCLPSGTAMTDDDLTRIVNVILGAGFPFPDSSRYAKQ
ncbi:DegT/DnrJ/EryC1/StrS aminotransferase domain-containing protein [Desulfonema limicola]|uniref:DegT/DnrJ/EryC1/StrS aminotransferase domain-containing protein n=1 Tax=Desulfonema limicola TaxID=45656 RepID=A0A975GJ79_9BACT|nr:DegT/DnrJ/EryC1/StrS family aminotransferase [Desulfonema limicola]QTA83249.1 DegT/DnrJ/EryC1/StrS aminotransferase domain-containing protein [Desulfonema limicola]